MLKQTLIVCSICITTISMAQNYMTPEKLWQVKKVSPVGLTHDQKKLVYKVATPDIETQQDKVAYFQVSLQGGKAVEVQDYKTLVL